jgi:N-methylhydantoinase B
VTTVDPITVEVIRNALNSAADEMSVNLARSAYTPIIHEMKDYSVAIFNRDCELLGQSPGLPSFLGALEDAVKAILVEYPPETMAPKDAYLINDPYLVGSHLNDVTVVMPAFFRDELVGFAASKAHWLDVGSKEPSQTMSAVEIYEEGIRLGPTRIMRRGRINSEVMNFLQRNSRLPISLKGDFYAQVAACRTGEERLATLIERFGKRVVDAASQAIFEQCELQDRAVVASLPDGTWEAEAFMDDDGHGHDPVRVRLRVTIAGSDVYIDLDGSAPQTSGCMNSGFSQTVSSARLAFKFLINPEVTPSGGSFRCLHVSAPDGTLFAAREPAACQYYGAHQGLLIDLFIKIMAHVMPSMVTGAQCADAMNVFLTGRSKGSRPTWVVGEATAVGWGAHQTGDGHTGITYGGGDLKNFPVEIIESQYPVRIHGYGLVPDTGGAGAQRGGLAVFRDYEVLEDNTEVSLWFERSLSGPWGVFGGQQGRVPRVLLRRSGYPGLTALKCSHVVAAAGSRLRIETGGGGGYGDPARRDRDLVARDVADGHVSAAAARDEYGYLEALG